MRILVAGCGKIGTAIVASLAQEGHDVVAIDNDPAVLGRLTNIYDVIAVTGNAADCDTLDEAGIASAQLFVAVTGSDELNMLSCYMAGRMGAEHTIARIRNPEYNDRSLNFIKQQLGLSMAINPDLLAAQELFNLLRFPSADKIETFSRRNFEMIELRLKLDSPLNGMRLSDLRKKFKANVLVGVVQRGDDVYIPDGSFILQAGDKIGLTATPTELQKLLRETNQLQRQARSVMILGGSRTAYYLAKQLTAGGHGVRLIEKDLEHCRELSELLPKAVIIHGDGAQQELLLEEGLGSVDAFVALTGMDEENILISIF
ncbi:MAG: Trk system potassium transporter TrkA, partial [Acutalibacteraceae bacterium]